MNNSGYNKSDHGEKSSDYSDDLFLEVIKKETAKRAQAESGSGIPVKTVGAHPAPATEAGVRSEATRTIPKITESTRRAAPQRPATPSVVRPETGREHTPPARQRASVPPNLLAHRESQRAVRRDPQATSLYNHTVPTARAPGRRPGGVPSSGHGSGGKRPGENGKGGGKGYSGTALSSVLKAVIYIVSVFVVAGLIGYYGIVIGNDVFAFVKSDSDVEITIGENTSTAELASILKKNGVIRFPGIFKLYASLRHESEPYVAGTYTVKPSMNFDHLREAFKEQKAEATVISITIPEGYTAEQIIDLFVSDGIGTREGFIDAIQNYNFEGYWFLDELEASTERKYRLEGYLYPDTYYFYNNSSEISVIYKLLDRFGEIFPETYRDTCAERGMTVDQIVTLASMIQMEAKYEAEYGWISSVFNNRLNNPSYETQGYLQSDATTQYGLSERKDTITGADNQIDGPYNTYMRKGLPVGPITNPSYSAITWALFPTETDYYYFVAKSDGFNLFAKTSAEHARNIIEARGG